MKISVKFLFKKQNENFPEADFFINRVEISRNIWYNIFM